MDCLPIHEQPGWNYASKRPTRCTPAPTTATRDCFLGAAQYLAETRNFDGRRVPLSARRKGGAAGAQMCEMAMMDRWGIQGSPYGMHNGPVFPAGQFNAFARPFFARHPICSNSRSKVWSPLLPSRMRPSIQAL